jgi:transposase
VARKVKKIEVSTDAKLALEKGYREGQSHCYRQRCQMVLLKLEGYKSKEIGSITGCCEMSVNNWIRRFEQQGIAGLRTKEGRGRKPILTDNDLAIVRAAVQQERQRLNQAKAIIEQSTGKTMSKETLTRFLKLITAVTDESENVPKANVTSSTTKLK